MSKPTQPNTTGCFIASAFFWFGRIAAASGRPLFHYTRRFSCSEHDDIGYELSLNLWHQDEKASRLLGSKPSNPAYSYPVPSLLRLCMAT